MPTERDTYRDELFKLGHGSPIYGPDPADAYDKVRVGDVGYVDEYGFFHRVFNIFEERTHTINQEYGTPVDFAPLGPNLRRANFRSPLPPGAIHSESLKVIGAGLDASGSCIPANASFTFNVSKQQGAALIVKYPAFREDIISERALGTYMLKNYRSWLRFIQEDLQRLIELHDIVLVTGCDLTADWAIATFFERSEEYNIEFKAGDISLGVSGSVGFWGRWQSAVSVPHRCGPVPVRPLQAISSSSPEGRILLRDNNEAAPFNYNQCIFLSGFRVRERVLRAPKIIKAGAGPKDLDRDRDRDLTPIKRAVEDDSDESSEDASSTKNDAFDKTVFPNERRSVYDALFDYIFEKSDADVALIHDNDVGQIIQNADTDLVALETYLEGDPCTTAGRIVMKRQSAHSQSSLEFGVKCTDWMHEGSTLLEMRKTLFPPKEMIEDHSVHAAPRSETQTLSASSSTIMAPTSIVSIPLRESSAHDIADLSRSLPSRSRESCAEKSLASLSSKTIKDKIAPFRSELRPPKLAPSAWQLFFTEWIQGYQLARGDVRKLNVAEAAKEAGAEYANLTAEQKEPYKRSSQLLKEQREREVAAWQRTLTPENIRRENAFRAAQRKDGNSRKGKLKDPNAPRRPLSAYFMFLQHIRADPGRIKRIFGDEKDIAAQSVLAAQTWRAMTDEEREPFLAQAEKEKLAYEAAQRLYEEGDVGFETMSSRSNTNDSPVALGSSSSVPSLKPGSPENEVELDSDSDPETEVDSYLPCATDDEQLPPSVRSIGFTPMRGSDLKDMSLQELFLSRRELNPDVTVGFEDLWHLVPADPMDVVTVTVPTV